MIVKCTVDKLYNQESFAADSLFCEWAYVIDLDKNAFEVYKGFNRVPLEANERFYYLQEAGKHISKHQQDDIYYPIKHLKTYDINALPSEDDFIKECTEKEEEEN